HTDHTLALLVDGAIGVAHTGGRSKRLWFAAGYLTIEALVEKVGEVHDAIPDGKSPASVFVDPGAHVKRGWGHVGDTAIRSATDNAHSASLRWSRFCPVEV